MGLKESKKYAIGSIHENGGGKFEILERWFDEENSNIMLKYKFENGIVETNKEVNVNASEWKWRKVRGRTAKQEHEYINESIIAMTDIEEYFEGIYSRIDKHNAENKDNFKYLQEALNEQQKMLIELMSVIKLQQKEIDALATNKDIISKLLEKI